MRRCKGQRAKARRQSPKHCADFMRTKFALSSLRVGEGEASERGLKLHVEKRMTTGWYQSRRIAEACSAITF